ncbi:MAG: PaaI family thioesterase [Actinobacteria bacterium]|nr:PaaI family thioesterase [Actinomycetota bacterium]
MGVADADFPLRRHLGMDVGSPVEGTGRAELVVGPVHLNPNGVAHGAVLFAMVDTAMGAATMSMLDEGLVCASIDVQLRFLRPVAEGRVVADAAVVKLGRRIVHLEARVLDDADRVVAMATGAFAVIGGGT